MLEGLKLRLIDDWRKAWKFSSMRCIALGAACQGAVVATPYQVAQYVPHWVWSSLSVFSLFCLIAAGVGRVTTTEPRNEPQPPVPRQ